MDTRARAALSVAIIALSVGATLLAWRLRPPPPPPPAESNEPVFDFDARTVRSFELASWRGTLRAERVDGHWQVRSVTLRRPLGEPGAGRPTETPSPDEVDRVVGGLAHDIVGLPVIDRFPRDGKPLADFGLVDPQAVIALGLDNGTIRRLEIGALTFSSSALYARAAPPDDILQVGTLLMTSIDSALYRLAPLAGPDEANADGASTGAAPPPNARPAAGAAQAAAPASSKPDAAKQAKPR